MNSYQIAEKVRRKSMDKDWLRHELSEVLAYTVVIGVSVLTFALSVLGG